MTIWLLTIILLLSLVGLGYRQGAIRVAFSLVGIIIGGVAAMLLGHLLVPVWKSVGVKNPFLPPVLGQLLVFAIVMSIVKSAALVVHRRTYVHYKHKEGELRFMLWERLNRRLGLCLGLANGALYLMLASYAISVPTYWTYQLGGVSPQNPITLKTLNRMGEDLQKTGMNEVAGAVKSMPDSYYDAADLVGLIYNNPDLQPRLARYPSIISLVEKPELKDLTSDPDVAALWSGHASISQFLSNPKVQTILHNPDLLKSITDTLVADLKDLQSYLTTGVSAKYGGEKILGKWDFNVNASYVASRKGKKAVGAAEILQLKNWFRTTFQSTTFAAGSDHFAILKGVPKSQLGNPADTETLTGKWENDGSNYKVRASATGNDQEFPTTLDNGKLTIEIPGLSMVFTREE